LPSASHTVEPSPRTSETNDGLAGAANGCRNDPVTSRDRSSRRNDPAAFWGWMILLGAFVADATITLVRRLTRGHRFDEAHRSHAYQYLSRRLRAHPPVSLAYGAVTLFWLFPLAILVTTHRLGAATGLAVAYGPLIAAVIWLKAGAPESQEV